MNYEFWCFWRTCIAGEDFTIQEGQRHEAMIIMESFHLDLSDQADCRQEPYRLKRIGNFADSLCRNVQSISTQQTKQIHWADRSNVSARGISTGFHLKDTQ